MYKNKALRPRFDWAVAHSGGSKGIRRVLQLDSCCFLRPLLTLHSLVLNRFLT